MHKRGFSLTIFGSEAPSAIDTRFEIAILFYSAADDKGLELTLTKNYKDYKKAKLPVMSPATLLKMVDQV